MSTLHQLEVATQHRCQLVDVTDAVRSAVGQSGVRSGLCVVFSPHTTAGVTVQENSDPDVQHDLLLQLGRLVPKDPSFRHAEGNADSHIKTSMLGSSATLIIADGKLLLGHWQAIYLCELDGPRQRQLHVKLIADPA
jgi:secondary thiamine-phosphate synthase enzyme